MILQRGQVTLLAGPFEVDELSMVMHHHHVRVLLLCDCGHIWHRSAADWRNEKYAPTGCRKCRYDRLPEMPGHRHCARGDHCPPLSEFAGSSGYCRPCASSYQRAYRQARKVAA